MNQSNDSPLEIVTVDSVQYLFAAGMYRFNNDTLIGMIQENTGKISSLVNIPLKNITRAEFNTVEIDAGQSARTTLTVVGVVGIVTGIIVLILIANSLANK